MFGMNVSAIAVTSQPPANVAVFLEVKDGDAAVTGLQVGAFRLFENGEELAPETSQLTLLDPELAAEQHAVLLVDVSGGGSEQLAKGVGAFTAKLRRTQAVTVLAFDGGALPRPIAELPKQADASGEPLAALAGGKAVDPSRDLNGAFVAALERLEKQLASSKRHVHIGTIITFARGPDLAGRVTDKEVAQALTRSRASAYAIGLPDPEDKAKLAKLGPAGVDRAESEAALAIAFERAAQRIADDAKRYYLLSYCSPSRAGARTLRVEVTRADAERSDRRGVVDVKFVASGFGPGCDPKTPPKFGAPTAEPAAEPTPVPSASAAPATTGTAKPVSKPVLPKTTPTDGVIPPPDNPRYTE